MSNLFERSFLMALGAAVLTKEMAESMGKELLGKGEGATSEGRKLIDESVAQAKEQTRTLRTHFDETLQSNFHEMGLVTGDQVEELKLKIAQLEHRIGLLEAEVAIAAEEGEKVHPMTREEEAEVEGLSPRLDTP